MRLRQIAAILAFFIIVGGSVSALLNFGLTSKQGTINPNALTGVYNPLATSAIFNDRQVSVPRKATDHPVAQSVLGETSDVEKRIEVDLTNQRLYAYEGDQMIYDFLISSGKWAPTPTGVFRIWIKLRYTLMEGGSKLLHTYYFLPNVPYTMYFTNSQVPEWEGYGLHGTYWHHNFGHPMSHGCINLETDDAEKLYYWTTPELNGLPSVLATAENPGTLIFIYGKAPPS